MLRQLSTVLTLATIATALSSVPSLASTLRCSAPDTKGTVHCWKEGKDGKPIPGSGTIHRRKSLGKVAYSVPQTNPSQPKPVKGIHTGDSSGDSVAGGSKGRIVESEKDCKGVALVDPDTKQIICYDTQAFSNVSYAISFESNCPIVARSKDRVFRMCHPVEDPSVPIEKQDPATIYPGLPPVPPKMASVCNPLLPKQCPKTEPKNPLSFNPPKSNPTPRLTDPGATRVAALAPTWQPDPKLGSAKKTFSGGRR